MLEYGFRGLTDIYSSLQQGPDFGETPPSKRPQAMLWNSVLIGALMFKLRNDMLEG